MGYVIPRIFFFILDFYDFKVFAGCSNDAYPGIIFVCSFATVFWHHLPVELLWD
jgi:hypothetical protein